MFNLSRFSRLSPNRSNGYCGLGKVYLNTFPSNALAIARHVARNPETKPQLLAILTAGEPLTNEIRRQCAEHLGCSCIDLYSSAECGLIASDCPVGECDARAIGTVPG